MRSKGIKAYRTTMPRRISPGEGVRLSLIANEYIFIFRLNTFVIEKINRPSESGLSFVKYGL
jgi:hypothetical protein